MPSRASSEKLVTLQTSVRTEKIPSSRSAAAIASFSKDVYNLTLTVNGLAPPPGPWGKGPLRPGDVLLLSRPIGSGVLLAAAMVGAARPEWVDQVLHTMQQSQAPLVGILAAHGCHACTDVTGFGLLGPLGEMLSPTTRAVLDPLAIPALPGALPLLARGHASSLAPSNATALALLEPGGAVQLERPCDAERLQLMIDPQTCGPLLAALPAATADAALEELQRTGFPQAAIIGTVQTR